MNQSTSKILRRATRARYNTVEAALTDKSKIRREYQRLKKAVNKTPRNIRGKILKAFTVMESRSKMAPVDMEVTAPPFATAPRVADATSFSS